MSPGKARISAMLIAGLLSFVVALGWGFTRRSGQVASTVDEAPSLGASEGITDIPAATGLELGTMSDPELDASATHPQPRALVPAKNRPTTSSVAPSASTGCSPPYVLEPGSGRKRWKVQCL